MKNELINQYLFKQMSIKEQTRFELEMSRNRALKEEVEITKIAIESVEKLGRKMLKDTLQNIHAEIYDHHKKNLSADG